MSAPRANAITGSFGGASASKPAEQGAEEPPVTVTKKRSLDESIAGEQEQDAELQSAGATSLKRAKHAQETTSEGSSRRVQDNTNAKNARSNTKRGRPAPDPVMTQEEQDDLREDDGDGDVDEGAEAPEKKGGAKTRK